MHSKKLIRLNPNIEYIKLNKNLYWVDDIYSEYYNQLVDVTKANKDWKSAEHLIKYQKQYEYAIEIKSNAKNVPGKGSAIFIHCSVNRPTQGCIAIKREMMVALLKNINLIEEVTIIIK